MTDLAATRTSHRWASHTGNFDRVNMRALFDGSGPYDLPQLPRATWIPDRLVAYSDRHECDRQALHGGAAVHTFIDDYRFEPMWSQPHRSLPRIAAVGAALTPDFSVWDGAPLALQVWQVYRSRWCGAWLASHGVTVIPTVTWAAPATHSWAFDGIPRGSVVAVSAVGIRGDQARQLFARGYLAMIDHIQPAAVLAYGPLPPGLSDTGPDVHQYPTRWEERKHGRQGK